MANKSEIITLQNLMRKFLQGENQSTVFVNNIEGFVIENFSDTDFYDDLIYALSLYRLGRGENLFDEKALGKEFTLVFTKLQELK